MIAQAVNLMNFLKGPKPFIIPIYQRTYSWTLKTEILKLYIAYKSSTNFVDVVPQKSRLRLSVNMRFSEIDDPKGLCKDVMYLVAQSFERSVDNGGQ